MNPHDPNRPDAAFLGLETGVVLDRDDPEKLGRVRVRIPGVMEQGTGWALPFGGHGGSKQQGAFHVPQVGADVIVFFRHGDPDQPFYTGGWQGRGEQLTSSDGSPDVYQYETPTYTVQIDERAGAGSLIILDKVSGNRIQMAERGITIKALAYIALETEGHVIIRGLDCFINDVQTGLGKI
jgi:uncharacterized protein involved in type VI secretion and phage assembly